MPIPGISSDVRLVGAPMAGGPTTPALVRAVSRAGGLGMIAGGYAGPDALVAQIDEVRASGLPFGVNLFAPTPVHVDKAELRAYAHRLRPEAERYAIELDPAIVIEDDDAWDAKIDLLVAHPVPLVSVTFGLPPRTAVDALHRVGTAVGITVTSVAEARAAADRGGDLLVVQGGGAGGHSGTHDPGTPTPPVSLVDLVAGVRAAVDLPMIAAGGIDGAERVRDTVAAGADAVAVGTLLLRTDEAGTRQGHRDALVDPRFTTTVTRCFTGRPARALRNGFVDRHEDHAPLGYPAVHHLTKELRAAAAAAGDVDGYHLWAGTGHRNARTGPAGDIVTDLVRLL